MSAPLTLTDCRPEVLAFALLMEAELRANGHKPDWKDAHAVTLAHDVCEQATSLRDLILDCYRPKPPVPLDEPRRHSFKSPRERIASETAHVALMAMRTADVCGALPALTEEKAQP